MKDKVFANKVRASSPLALSIVTPFFKNDPSLLLSILTEQTKSQPVEIIILDDGSGDQDLNQQVRTALSAITVPARLIILAHNLGRAAARNRLIGAAKAPYILFLDSDMAPDHLSFLRDWLTLIEQSQPDIAYGGFSTHQIKANREMALAKAVAEKTDCDPASKRARRGGNVKPLGPQVHIGPNTV
jgi:glycosyltransferase involved in cell wall biosynthesis